ncbi:MAG: acetate--CoA ligase family protein [Myxococcota bacterium]
MWTLLSDSADIVVECTERAREIGLNVEVRLEAETLSQALELEGPVALALLRPLDPEQLLEAAKGSVQAIVSLGDHGHRGVALDLGLFAPREVDGLIAGLAAMAFETPWRASLRSLRATDRRRLQRAALDGGPDGDLRLVYGERGLALARGATSVALGAPHAVRDAFTALASRGPTMPSMPAVEGLDASRVMDVILGPARALSDPASKTALAAYDVPLPEEVLCGSASRAATEAQRIGFPVRVTLASPDLRAWDHPDLSAEGVDNAARVRDVFRRFTALAKERTDPKRILGVVVSATTSAAALLRVRFRSIGSGVVLADVGFADPHGLAAGDRTSLVLPCRYDALEARLRRLRGHPLILAGTAAQRRRRVEELADVLLRVAAFADDWRAEVEEVRLDTVALLLGGGAEIREACVVVGEAFTRSLETGLES